MAVTKVATAITTTTITKTSTVATVTHTATAAATPFYMQVASSPVTSVRGKYAVVSGEFMTFVSNKAQASNFTIDASSHLTSGTNGWVANMQNGSTFSTLFFDSPALVTKLGLIQAVCNRASGSLSCTDQTSNTLYYCETVGAQLVMASASYKGAGCVPITLNAINA